MFCSQSLLRKLCSLLLMLPLPGAEITAPGQFPNLQSALNTAKPGDVVIVAPGRYHEQLVIPEGVTLQTKGDAEKGEIGLARAEATIIDSQGKAPAVTLLEGATLDGMSITGAGVFNQEEFDQHHEQRGENLADNHGAVGTENNSSAISISGVTATVRNCLVHDNGFAGIGVIGPSKATISNNWVFRNMGGGIGIANRAVAKVSENSCWQNLRAGIGCRNSSPIISHNHCFKNVRAGIGIREGATPDVFENTCYENRRAGIGIRMARTEPRIFKNRCYNNGMAGIGCRDQSAPIIFENECYQNRLAGIGAMSNARPSIIGNTIYQNQAAAIGLDACEDGEALILKNTIKPLKLVGIGIQAGWTVQVKENHLERVGGMPPLVMVFQDANADFIGNHFVGSGVAAIRCQGNIFVADNQFDCPSPRQGGPPQFAVWALEGSNVAMTADNQINGWRQPEISTTRVSNSQELLSALQNAKPGTTILMNGGNYKGGISLNKLHGTASQPITLSAANLKDPPIIQAGNSGLHFEQPQHLSLRYLTIKGASFNGLNIDDGGSFDSPAHHILLDGLRIQDIGSTGNHDGIKLSGVQNFKIQDCHLKQWGKGGSGIDLVGCHEGIISGCHFEHQENAIAANGVQAKGGSREIRITRCHFKHAGGRSLNLGGSTGAAYFRPQEASSEASDLVVQDCFFEGSLAPIAFVGVKGAVVRNNTILEPKRWIARILQENTDQRLSLCQDGRFENNLVIFHSQNLAAPVNIGPQTRPETFQFDQNEWKCLDGKLERLTLPTPETNGIYQEGSRGSAKLSLPTRPGIGMRLWTSHP